MIKIRGNNQTQAGTLAMPVSQKETGKPMAKARFWLAKNLFSKQQQPQKHRHMWQTSWQQKGECLAQPRRDKGTKPLPKLPKQTMANGSNLTIDSSFR